MKRLILLLLLLTIPYISAEAVCIPGTDSLCKNPIEMGGYLYCDIDDVKVCSQGCVSLNYDSYCNNVFSKLMNWIKEFLLL